VVEIGAGTGANLAAYPLGAISELVLVEPESPMAARLRTRLQSVGAAQARVVGAPAESLPLPDASADFAVSTLVLCTVSDPARALAELRRVLKPGGRLLFIEHVRSQDARVARWQDRFQPAWDGLVTAATATARRSSRFAPVASRSAPSSTGRCRSRSRSCGR